jgi:superfamily II DNA/RNA helicase
MPRIFDNIEQFLSPTLIETLKSSSRADFCVGYFNMRGWKLLDSSIETWTGTPESRVRLLVGMQSLPQDELRVLYNLTRHQELDNATAKRLQRQMAEHFKKQLTYGAPSNADEAGLRRLSEQLKSGKVVVKLSVRQGLHAKLYLMHRSDSISPIVPYLGSSNLTLAGLAKQGELNVDVLDADAAQKLQSWFEDRWADRWSLDISQELIEIIDASWAGNAVTPYQIYIKMAYHLSADARAGVNSFTIPKQLKRELFEYQEKAVSIAANHLNKRGGVILGDVVGLGKTLMATALIKLYEQDFQVRTLIICPKNLVKMWQDYIDKYDLNARVLPITQVVKKLPEQRPNQLVLIDESHNLRNREGRRYKIIKEYIELCKAKCILLSATPYNKTYLDLSSQLGLFIQEETDLGIRPEALIRAKGEHELGHLQTNPRSIKAFEKSEFPDDWRELMRLFMVRRTRSFIQNIYAEKDDTGRAYLTFANGKRSYFPSRQPKTVRFAIDDQNPNDPYARLYSSQVIFAIENLILPRYGLGKYILEKPVIAPTSLEQKQIQNLGRAGKRLIGFCRTNLFKRLESGGTTFVQSLERHVLRNYIFLYALEHNLPLPIGTQTAELLDARFSDEDADDNTQTLLEMSLIDDETSHDDEPDESSKPETIFLSQAEMKNKAADIYNDYATQFKKRFKWLRSDLFAKELRQHLELDATAIQEVLKNCGRWNPDLDTKLEALQNLIQSIHPEEKILVFTQFADTVHYLERELKARGIEKMAGVVGSSNDPTALAWRFSPRSNDKKVSDELRVLISSDVLSEGQNLQDAHIVVNFDLPWAIIRLIQRAGRVDRIGQQAEKIFCYSFLPAEGVERIINLRRRVKSRLKQNAEVVGTDEQFFEDDDENIILDLYNEKSGLLDGETDTEVDLASYAYSIWQKAIENNPNFENQIRDMPNVVYAAKRHTATLEQPQGALVYARSSQGNDALVWLDQNGNNISYSQLTILEMAACNPNTPSQTRAENHHELVTRGMELVAAEDQSLSGQLGKRSDARFKTYQRLKTYAEKIQGSLFENQAIHTAIDEIYRYPLLENARDTLGRQLKNSISDEDLMNLVLTLREDNRLCNIQAEQDSKTTEIICSLGLV